ncbi:glycine rich domain-containing protein [Segatella albensis]|uniref:glycine rich domain-containing protein n=1 Tax=Segatella albensis TaxID=77768 RepID=UPI0009DC0358|nr:glycine rich domain-containing protein [Segatella albensis]
MSGYTGCDTISESSTENYIIHTGQPNHYSGYVFTNSVMIAGDAIMPKPGGGTETGHSGDGYAIISWISPSL